MKHHCEVTHHAKSGVLLEFSQGPTGNASRGPHTIPEGVMESCYLGQLRVTSETLKKDEDGEIIYAK